MSLFSLEVTGLLRLVWDYLLFPGCFVEYSGEQASTKKKV